MIYTWHIQAQITSSPEARNLRRRTRVIALQLDDVTIITTGLVVEDILDARGFARRRTSLIFHLGALNELKPDHHHRTQVYHSHTHGHQVTQTACGRKDSRTDVIRWREGLAEVLEKGTSGPDVLTR